MYSERGRYVIKIDISREISIEHPSVGLASLAQLGVIYNFLPARASEQGNVIGLVSVYIYSLLHE